MQAYQENQPDAEARALAACYRLLLRKARQRRVRLAQEEAAETQNTPVTDRGNTLSSETQPDVS
jgi:hypothetical protein